VRIEAAVLAAGRGERMGRPKHLIPIEGAPMVARVVEALRAAGLDRVFVVLRRGDAAGAALCEDLAVPWVAAEPGERGRAASVRAAVEAASAGADGLLFALADQPYLRPEDFAALATAFRGAPQAIVRATYAGAAGSPVLFARRFFPELAALADRWPEVTFVLSHAGLPLERTPATLREWSDAATALARHPNWVCKISALCGGSDPDWTVASIRPWAVSASSQPICASLSLRESSGVSARIAPLK